MWVSEQGQMSSSASASDVPSHWLSLSTIPALSLGYVPPEAFWVSYSKGAKTGVSMIL